jgi:hypothetical protein
MFYGVMTPCNSSSALNVFRMAVELPQRRPHCQIPRRLQIRETRFVEKLINSLKFVENEFMRRNMHGAAATSAGVPKLI